MRKALRTHLRRTTRISGFAALTAGMLPMYLAHQRLPGRRPSQELRDAWVRRWSDALLRLFAIELVVLGEVPPRTQRGRLVVANHRSTIDIGVMLRTFGGQMVSRGDLSGWPLVGPAARAVGTVFVDRASSTSGAHAVRAMGRLLRAGDVVNLFAEGTTFADDEVRPFHAGAFVAACGARAEIVPAGIAYDLGSGAAFVNERFTDHLVRLAGAPPSRVVLAIGDPLPMPERPRAADLTRATHEAVQALVHAARRALG